MRKKVMQEREKYQKAKELFHIAVKLADREREDYLIQTCAGDDLLRQEVELLLAADERANNSWEWGLECQIAEQIVSYNHHKDSFIGCKLNNRYIIERKLAQGGFGAAYLAIDEQLHARRVAIKILLERQGEYEWVRKKFGQEIAALARINHPGVVTIFDSGITADARPFFVMEYVNGYSLRSQIDSTQGLVGGFPRIANIIRQLGEAIAAAHQNGIYHRDLKPENIMLRKLGEQEQVKVLDFGIATIKDSYEEKSGTTQHLAGSILYMAPEQLNSKPAVASDIYAMGVIAYEMITGRTPFMLDTAGVAAMFQLLNMQMEGVKVKPQQLCPELPDRAEAEVLKALSYDLEARHEEAQDLGNRLADALINITPLTVRKEKATAKTIPNFPLPKQKAKSRHAAIIAIMLILIAMVTTLFVFNTRQQVITTPVTKATIYKVNYWAEWQRYRNGKPLGDAIKLSSNISQETYATGDTIRLFITSSHNGYLYLISEEISTDTTTPLYTIIFPSPAANGGLAEVRSAQQVATSPCEFDRQAGEERLWLIWSSKKIVELGTMVATWVNSQEAGEIKNGAEAAFLQNLIHKYNQKTLVLQYDNRANLMQLQTQNDLIIYPLRLMHQ
jgi:serine/threonine protein kinase